MFVIVVPAADFFRDGSGEAPTSAASVSTRHLVVGKPTSVSELALRFGATPFTLYALSGHRVHGPVARAGTRLRVPTR